MAEHKDYGLIGVGRNLQFGKQGPVLVGNADTDTFTVTMQDGATLTTMGGANATDTAHFITKAQLDVVYTEATFKANVNYNDSSPILLGNITSGTKTIITTLTIGTAFDDANAVVTIGTSANANLLMSDNYCEIEVNGVYQTVNIVEFANNTSLNIYVTQAGATAGAGNVLVSVVDGPVVDGGTINYGGGGIALANLSVSVNSPSGNGSLTYSNTTGVFTFTPADASLSNYGNSNVVTLLSSLGSNSIVTTGNISANNIIGNISITGNVAGTSTNVTLVAGSYSTVFDNTGNTAFANGTVSLTTLSATGNITSGNIVTTGNVSGNTAGFAIGYRDIPQVSFTGNATIATTDAGKHFYSTQSSNFTLTIANNASQGFQIGAAITVVNQGTGTITVAQGSGVTLYLAGNATASNRSVATFGMATIIKVATNTWFINGTGVS